MKNNIFTRSLLGKGVKSDFFLELFTQVQQYHPEATAVLGTAQTRSQFLSKKAQILERQIRY